MTEADTDDERWQEHTGLKHPEGQTGKKKRSIEDSRD